MGVQMGFVLSHCKSRTSRDVVFILSGFNQFPPVLSVMGDDGFFGRIPIWAAGAFHGQGVLENIVFWYKVVFVGDGGAYDNPVF